MEEENKNLNVEEPTEVLGNTGVIEPVVEEPVTEPVVETPVESPVMEAPVENPGEVEPVAVMAQVETKADEVPAETVTPMPEPASVPAEPVQETPVAQPVEVPAEEPKKKSKLPLILLLLLVLAAGGFAVWYFVLGGNGAKKEEPKKEEEQKEEEKKEKIEEIDVSSDEVTEVLDAFNLISINETELTRDDSYNISNLTFKQKVETIGKIAAIKGEKVIAYCGNDVTTDLTIEKLNEFLKEAVDASITKEELESNGKEETIKTLENEVQGISVEGNGEFWIWIIDGKYYIHSNNCDGNDLYNIVYKKLIKAEKDSTHLYVYEKRGFYNIEDGDTSNDDGSQTVKIDYYKDSAKTELVETIEGLKLPSINSKYEQEKEITWDKYNTYKYTFKIKDGNYYFEKYELVK